MHDLDIKQGIKEILAEYIFEQNDQALHDEIYIRVAELYGDIFDYIYVGGKGSGLRVLLRKDDREISVHVRLICIY